jgi:geranylgeranyl diphosphate synthase type II
MIRFEDFLSYFSEKLMIEVAQIKERIPQKLYEPVIYSLQMGGKRLRPVLLLMSYNLFKPDIERALPAAFAIELFHNFTLLHDDIMDDASLRRNLETVHVKYCENAAILSGDAMSILSYEYIIKCKSDNLCEILKLYTNTALKICEGQQFDMDFETSSQITVDEYINMIGLKTAILLATSLKLGALIAEASAHDAECLYHFGYHLGLAFQLQDDLLDTFGNTAEFGKNIGGDIVSNKKTFLLLSALRLADSNQKEELNKWLSVSQFDKKEKITCVRTIFSELKIEQLTQEQIDYYFTIAFEWLRKLNIEDEKKAGLMDIANQMINRKN